MILFSASVLAINPPIGPPPTIAISYSSILSRGIFPKIYNRIVDTLAGIIKMFTSIFQSIISQEIIGIILLFKGKKNKQNDFEKDNENRLLCRFVLDGAGRKIGESIAIDDDILIIKAGMKYLGVPLKHIDEEKKTLLVKGLVEQDKAEMMGEKWRRESFYKMDDVNGNDDGF